MHSLSSRNTVLSLSSRVDRLSSVLIFPSPLPGPRSHGPLDSFLTRNRSPIQAERVGGTLEHIGPDDRSGVLQ
jgi:hypothetical protein